MSVRGRGCLEIRSSNNPFFQSTSNDIGRTIENTPSDWAIKGEPPKFSTKKREVDGNFLFLYSRESDRIGERLPKPASAEVRMLSRTEFLKQRRERALTQSGGQEIDLNAELEQATTTQKLTAQELLQVYKHEPKYEDPRYITSQVSIVSLIYSKLLLMIFFLSM